MDNCENTPKAFSEILTKFFDALPPDERIAVSKILKKLSYKMDEVIGNDNPVAKHINKLKQLRAIFVCIPFTVRVVLESILIDGLSHCESLESVPVCIATTCLCLLELCSFRNIDRMDIECESLEKNIAMIVQSIIPRFTETVVNLRTNLPSLLSWSLCMLVFTCKSCQEWMQQQGYEIKLVTSVDKITIENVLKHPSIPVIMLIVLKAQMKKRYFLQPPHPHTLFDLLFANAISNSIGLINSSTPVRFDAAKCIIEQSEPPLKKRKDTEIPKHISFPEKCDDIPISYDASLHDDDMENLLANLKIMYQLTIDSADLKNTLLNSFQLTLKHTSSILNRARKQTIDGSNVTIYEQVYCVLLQLWFVACEKRLLLNFPQSYLCLVGFTQPFYEIMTFSGFVQVILWTGRFLTMYQGLFRSSILASPHWYLQIIIDGIIAIIDRSENAVVDGDATLDEIDETLHMCALALSRPFSALNVEESDTHAELSRVIKTPLESIISRIASCKIVSRGRKKSKVKNIQGRPAISQRLRDSLTNHLLLPMIRSCDIWALGQAKIGLRPLAAKVMLKQLLSEPNLFESNNESIHAASKFDQVRTISAIGGLHITEKLFKRKR